MASSTSEQTTNREGTEPVEEQADSAEQNGSNHSEALAAAKRAAGTAAAAALAGALVGAGKALLERRATSDGTDTDEAAADEDFHEPVETEASSAPSAADDQSEPAEESESEESESDEPPAETTARGESYEEEDEEDDEEENVPADPAARREETESDETADDSEGDDSTERGRPQSGASSSNVAKIVERARDHAHDLLGEEPESVTGIDRSNGSWSVTLEVVELHRVPETTDIMGAYELVLDDDGNLVSFDRTARYVRSQVEDVS